MPTGVMRLLLSMLMVVKWALPVLLTRDLLAKRTIKVARSLSGNLHVLPGLGVLLRALMPGWALSSLDSGLTIGKFERRSQSCLLMAYQVACVLDPD
jgi:hypothetical protein